MYMKKTLIGGVLVIIVGAYVWWSSSKNAMPVVNTTVPTTDTATTTPIEPAKGSTPPSTKPVSTAQYKDGTYNGSVATSVYGAVQVSVIVSGGKITDVKTLQAPTGGRSGELSVSSTAALRTETLTAQSAKVDIISGATQTSEAFQQSLQVALTAAKA